MEGQGGSWVIWWTNMANYLYIFLLLSSRDTFVKLANCYINYLLSFKGYKMPGRSLLHSCPAYVKILAEIPIKILEARAQGLLDWSWTRPPPLSKGHPSSVVLGSTQLISLTKFLYFSLHFYHPMHAFPLTPNSHTHPWFKMCLYPFARCVSAGFSCLWSDIKTLSFPHSLNSSDLIALPNSFFRFWIWSLEKTLRWKDRCGEESLEGRRTCVGNVSERESWDVAGQCSVLDHRALSSTSVIPYRKELKEDENAKNMLY